MPLPAGSASQFACPQCGSPVASQDVTCTVCGANIALVTLLAEHQLLGRAASDAERPRPSSVEQLVPRLGDYLVRSGYITQAQLKEALARQHAAPAIDSRPPLLGQQLIEMGILHRNQLDQAVAQQILELQTALVEANRGLEKRVEARTAELEAALAKLTEFNQLKANFVANVSHELRTPLTQIKGYNSLLNDALLGPLTLEQKDAVSITARAIERLETLINDLISYSTTAKGELTLNLQPVSVSMVIARVMDKSLPKAQKRNVILTSQATPNLPPVIADEDKLLWVLLQLADNAIKFTPPEGRVVIAAAPEGQRIRLSVHDTGIGIPAARKGDLFQPFQQLDGSSTRRYGGTGLGLSLVQRLIEAHGSQVQVESEEGRGSLFYFTLAQMSAPPETKTESASLSV